MRPETESIVYLLRNLCNLRIVVYATPKNLISLVHPLITQMTQKITRKQKPRTRNVFRNAECGD